MSNVAKVAGAAANTLTTPLNVEEVFSTYLYTGNAPSSQTITNGIDLSGEGGLVWIKNRDATYAHMLHDTEATGVQNALRLPNTTGIGFDADSLTSFNSDGFTIGADAEVNEQASGSNEFVSWTFRKAPKFFTIVTYNGDGTTNRQISHDLGGTVGHITVKKTSNSAGWFNWHRTFSDNQLVAFSGNYAVGTYSNYLVTADSTTFTVGNNADVNASGETYVAYLWAHNDGDGGFGPTGDQDIIKCGSYTGNGSTTGPEIDLGFEPQWVMIKRTDSAADWNIIDTLRGWPMYGTAPKELTPNTSGAEASGPNGIDTLPNGFQIRTGNAHYNTSGGTYIYIAIRRGPMAVPEDADDVFSVKTSTATTNTPITAGFTIDSVWTRALAGTDYGFEVLDRKRQALFRTPSTDQNYGGSNYRFDTNDGYIDNYNAIVNSGNNILYCMWKRAPKYFDIVCYDGNGVNNRNILHNLEVAPEMIWVKRRDSSSNWSVYHSGIGNTKYLVLNTSNAAATFNYWGNTDPTETTFRISSSGVVNTSSAQYMAYLFASLSGISKLGSYTGNGSSQNIDCGFSNGARFVLIKSTSSGGDWNVFDTARGIVAGNDSRLTLNTTDPALTSYDAIDPLSSGFTVNSAISDINDNAQSYIFYAIA